MKGFYYLHTNGDMIYKNTMPDNSDFVRRIWSLKIKDREDAWKILLEASALGAREYRIKELSDKWLCDLKDCVKMLKRVKPTDLMRQGLPIWAKYVLGINENTLWTEIEKLWKEI